MTDVEDLSTAILTPANLITVIRILLAPLLIVLVVELGPSWIVFFLGLTLGMSDVLDGWIARRSAPTRAGAFLDPLADKVLVLGTLIALVARGIFGWVPVAIIGVRELAISIYRVMAGRHGVSVPARPLAKAKTFVQSWSAGFALMPPLAAHAPWVGTTMLWLAVVLTVVTGVQYFVDARRLAADQLT